MDRVDLQDPRVRIGLGVLLCAAIVAAAILMLKGGDDPPTESGEIESIVREFVSAGNERDFVVVCDLLSEQARGQIERVASAMALTGDDACSRALQARALETIGDQTVEVLAVRISGDRAAVDVATDDPEKGRSERTLELIRDKAGEWKVSTFGD